MGSQEPMLTEPLKLAWLDQNCEFSTFSQVLGLCIFFTQTLEGEIYGSQNMSKGSTYGPIEKNSDSGFLLFPLVVV